MPIFFMSKTALGCMVRHLLESGFGMLDSACMMTVVRWILRTQHITSHRSRLHECGLREELHMDILDQQLYVMQIQRHGTSSNSVHTLTTVVPQ